jgi:hypothetical protein
VRLTHAPGALSGVELQVLGWRTEDGKTHLAIALSIRACLIGQRVPFRTATEWVALLADDPAEPLRGCAWGVNSQPALQRQFLTGLDMETIGIMAQGAPGSPIGHRVHINGTGAESGVVATGSCAQPRRGAALNMLGPRLT